MGWSDLSVSVSIGRGGNRGRSLLAREGVDLLEPIADAMAAARRRGREDEEGMRDAPGERKEGRAGVDCDVANPPSFWGPGDAAGVKTDGVVGFGVMVGSRSASKAAMLRLVFRPSTGTESRNRL